MKRFEEPKSGTHHPPPTTHHKNEKKVSAVKIQILIKYKRIKWTPSCKASLLLPGGLCLVVPIPLSNEFDQLSEIRPP